jgi:hypothetical protein
VAELLPHYAKLLLLLDDLYSSKQLGPSTVVCYLSSLRVFLRSQQQQQQQQQHALQESKDVDYAAMMSSIGAAYNRSYKEQGPKSKAGRKCTTAVSDQAPSAAAAAATRKRKAAASDQTPVAAAAANVTTAAAATAAASDQGLVAAAAAGGPPTQRQR